MEGFLLIIGLILWFMKNGSKKKQANAKKGLTSTAKLRAERAVRMHDAIKEREQQRQAEEAKQVEHVEQLTLFEAAVSGEQVEGEGMERRLPSGSMLAESTEGEDLCDPTLGHTRPEPVEMDSVYAGEICRTEPLLDLSPRGIWQGVVMSEVLARPAQRLRRH